MTRTVLALVATVALAAPRPATAEDDDVAQWPATAADYRWTRTDTALELAFVAVQALDWAQTTTDIAPRCMEANPILGRCPSTEALVAYSLAAITGHAAVARALPGRWRTAWQLAWLGIGIGVTARSHALGYRVRF